MDLMVRIRSMSSARFGHNSEEGMRVTPWIRAYAANDDLFDLIAKQQRCGSESVVGKDCGHPFVSVVIESSRAA